MNLDYWPSPPPKKIMMINPLAQASQMIVVRMLSGGVFGRHQLVDIILLVYSNELQAAQDFIQELAACNFLCLNSIVATSDLPRIADADVFCFISNFPNPYILDYDNLNTDESFDSFYLIIKVAHSLAKSNPDVTIVDGKAPPIFITDGLIALDILNIVGKGVIPTDRLFCASAIKAIARTLLSSCLKVPLNRINYTYAWGANDQEFHVEFKKPFIVDDKTKEISHCDWEMVSEDSLQQLKLDHTQFNASWMRKEFIDKVKRLEQKNPHGDIYKCWQIEKCLTYVFNATGRDNYNCYFIISDGSLKTHKGVPYIFPLKFHGDKWEVDRQFEDLPHVVQEIKRYNVIAKRNHEKLARYCNKFLQDNVINQSFVPADEDDIDSSYSALLE